VTTLADYPKRYCSVCGHVVRKEFKPGPGGRPDASCPRCRSLERHRFFAVLLDVLRPMLGDVDVLLDVAPSPETTPLLARLQPRVHTRLDLGADNRLVDVLGSLTELPYRDGSVDLLMCYHVLEHVPDDLSAMREIARVLSPTGVGLLQVPYRPGTATDEDPEADEDERLRRFGQRDHVRYYGDDFEDRLVASGLSLQRVTPRSLLGSEMAVWLHLNPDEMVWLVRPQAGAQVPPRVEPGPTPLTQTFDALLGQLTGQRDRVVRLREIRAGLEAENARLRRVLAPAIRVRGALSGTVRRLRAGR
jgi:SAM-dependent methyltransferase